MKTYLITGAGSGIGRAVAIELSRGADRSSPVELVLVGRRAEALQETARELSTATKSQIVLADQRRPESVREAFRPLQLERRQLAGVVANAGIGGENTYGDGDRWGEIIETNLSGTYHVVSECLPALEASQAPARGVVIISSILARLGVPGYTAYCASKAGLLGLTRSWAAQYASRGIQFNAILPGWVNTEMARTGIRHYADHAKETYESALARQMAMVPTGKMAEPAEIAELVAFLLSGSQSSFTGQCFDPNNGALMP